MCVCMCLLFMLLTNSNCIKFTVIHKRRWSTFIAITFICFIWTYMALGGNRLVSVFRNRIVSVFLKTAMVWFGLVNVRKTFQRPWANISIPTLSARWLHCRFDGNEPWKWISSCQSNEYLKYGCITVMFPLQSNYVFSEMFITRFCLQVCQELTPTCQSCPSPLLSHTPCSTLARSSLTRSSSTRESSMTHGQVIHKHQRPYGF